MKKASVILASSSPRRREFLKNFDVEFGVIVPEVSEVEKRGEAPRVYARRLAVEKADAVFEQLAPAILAGDLKEMDEKLARVVASDELLIIAADTIVVRGKRMLQKPVDRADAQRMLRSLNGRAHEVVTGVCVLKIVNGKPVRERSFTVSTRVLFKKLTAAEIAGYVATGEPMDKAGAYAIQGIGSFLVKSIDGSYTNVVGLPVAELVDLLRKDFGFEVF